MKKIIIAAALIIGLAVNAQTAEKKDSIKLKAIPNRYVNSTTPEVRADIRVKRLLTDLNLTEKQQTEIKKVMINLEKERQKLVEESKANRKAGNKVTSEERGARKLKAIEQKNALDKELQKILTPEQLTKYEQNKVARKTELKQGKTLKIEPAQK